MRIMLLALLVTLGGCNAPQVEVVEAFRAEKAAGNLDAARAFLTDDPRVWYEARSGEGSAWNLAGGRWKEWDDHFRSTSDVGPWHVGTHEGGRTVWAIVDEMNDYFRLIEREGMPQYRLTYFLDADDRIEGYMISAANPAAPSASSRFDEIEAWAKANHPDEWAYLRPGDRLDPTGDRAPRTRALINRWRVENGLPPIE